MTAVETTKRVWAERALREREAELARVQEIGQVGGVEVFLTDGFRNRRSPEYLIIHGLPPEAVNETHEDWVRRIHPEDRERAERQFIEAVHGGAREYRAEYRIIRPSDGQVRWIQVKSEIERDADGKPLRLVGAHIDITERKRVEQALQTLNENLEQEVERAHARARPALERVRRSHRRGELRGLLGQHQSGRERDPRLEPERIARDADRVAVASRRCDHARWSIAGIWCRAARPSASRTAIATRTARTAGCRGPRPPRTASSTRPAATSPPSAKRPKRCAAPRSSCASRRRWKRSASSPAELRTISTIC